MAKKDTPPADVAAEAIAGTVAETTAPIAGGVQVGGFVGADPDAFAHVGDAHWGQGGRYIVGEDGKRVPAPVITESEENNHG